MKKVIYKYPIEKGNNSIELPVGAEVLDFGVSESEAVIWALVPVKDEEVVTEDEVPQPTEVRTFATAGTGIVDEYDDALTYKHIGTTQFRSGKVWHLFEVTAK